jgi:phage shock protein A
MTGQIDQLEAEVEAADVLHDPRKAEVEARFRKLEQEKSGGAVDDELAELKKRLEG